MILVDTSVWVDHLRHGRNGLAALLEAGEVMCHPFVIGELALGNLVNRGEIISLLGELPQVPVATHDEVLAFIEARRLAGQGLGYVDVHLLAAAVLEGTPLWTLDRSLHRAARALSIAHERP